MHFDYRTVYVSTTAIIPQQLEGEHNPIAFTMIRFADCVRGTDYGLYENKIADCVRSGLPVTEVDYFRTLDRRVICFDMSSEKAG